MRYPIVAIFSICFGFFISLATKTTWYIGIGIIAGQYLIISSIIDIYKFKICLDSWYLKAKKELEQEKKPRENGNTSKYNFKI